MIGVYDEESFTNIASALIERGATISELTALIEQEDEAYKAWYEQAAEQGLVD